MARDFIQLQLIGDAELENRLREFPETVQRRIVRAALNAGMRVMAKGFRAAAPKGPTGNLRKSIGQRIVNRRGMITTAKVGIDVGKLTLKKAASKLVSASAAHGHLVTLGTKQRRVRKTGKSVGRMTANPFIRRAYDANKSAAQDKIKEVGVSKYRSEWQKQKERGQRD